MTRLTEQDLSVLRRCLRVIQGYEDWDERKEQYGVLVSTTPLAALISGAVLREFGLQGPVDKLWELYT